jgi:hypothetical protein
VEHTRGRTATTHSKTGAASELLVAADLLGRGIDAFRAVSPDAPCDLMALKGITSARVEVKTVPKRAKTGLPYRVRYQDWGKCDILALYYPAEGLIEYWPALDTIFPRA